VSHLVPFAAGMGMCIIGLKLRRLGNRRGECGIEDADLNASSLVLFFLLHIVTGTSHFYSLVIS